MGDPQNCSPCVLLAGDGPWFCPLHVQEASPECQVLTKHLAISLIHYRLTNLVVILLHDQNYSSHSEFIVTNIQKQLEDTYRDCRHKVPNVNSPGC